MHGMAITVTNTVFCLQGARRADLKILITRKNTVTMLWGWMRTRLAVVTVDCPVYGDLESLGCSPATNIICQLYIINKKRPTAYGL